MLNTLFAANISTNTIARKQKDLLTECADHYLKFDNSNFGIARQYLYANNFYCIDNSKNPKYFYGIFAEGLTIEGQDADGNYFEPVVNSFASSLSLIKITAKDNCNADFLWIQMSPANQGTVEKVAIILKKSWQSRIKTTAEGSNIVSDVVVIPNSNNPSVTIRPDNGATASYSRIDMVFKETKNEITIGDSKMVAVYSNGIQGSVYVKSSAPTWSYCPNKVILYEDDKIYSSATPDYVIPDDGLTGDDPSPDNGGIGTGAIVGIVIAVIVVVAVAAFCIVWFVVLKKGCSSNNANAESPEV